ncbi:hypothetical protein OG930_13885 [Streptomyces sp. NBC_01799]|nr:hypothetical protein OG930_13885 [Streptomyces sp. NBC_01799]
MITRRRPLTLATPGTASRFVGQTAEYGPVRGCTDNDRRARLTFRLIQPRSPSFSRDRKPTCPAGFQCIPYTSSDALGHGPQPQEGLFPLDDDLTTEEYEELHETFEALGASTKLVCVFFTADPENGIHAIHWGDAPLEPDRTFTWLYSEQLSVASQPLV